MLNKLLNDCLTGIDNKTYSFGRVSLAISLLVFWALSIADVVRTKDFEYQAFGLGTAAILAAGGAAIGLQSSTEPKQDNPEDK